MKQIVTFSILFCLVFLNVPRSFVHDCEHDRFEHSHDDDKHELSIENHVNACFVCEFDLGFFSLPDFKIPAFSIFISYTFISPSVDYSNPDAFFAFSHRGPPIA